MTCRARRARASASRGAQGDCDPRRPAAHTQRQDQRRLPRARALGLPEGDLSTLEDAPSTA